MKISGSKQIKEQIQQIQPAGRIKTFVFPRRNIPYVASKYKYIFSGNRLRWQASH